MKKARAPAERSAPADLLIPQLLRMYHHVSRRVWADPAMRREERASTETRLVQWPATGDGTGYGNVLATLFDSDVDLVLAMMEAHGDPDLPELPPQLEDPKFQAVLRVVLRGFLQGKAAIESAFEGQDATGWREAKNQHKALGFHLAVTAFRDLQRHEALELLRLKKSSAYRANTRKPKR